MPESTCQSSFNFSSALNLLQGFFQLQSKYNELAMTERKTYAQDGWTGQKHASLSLRAFNAFVKRK